MRLSIYSLLKYCKKANLQTQIVFKLMSDNRSIYSYT